LNRREDWQAIALPFVLAQELLEEKRRVLALGPIDADD
jgi:hypothetical protein